MSIAQPALPPAALLRGVMLTSAAVFVFAVMDTTGKYLMAHYSVPFVMGIRYVGNLLLLIAIFAPRKGWGIVSTQRTGWVVVRGLSLAAASLLAGLALQRMPVGETIAIIYLQPFGIMIAANRLLGERVGPLGWAATAVGFLGVLLVARPGGGLDPWGVFFAVSAAVVSVAYQILSRSLAATETTEAMLFWTALVGAIAYGGTLPWSWQGASPGALDTMLLFGMGALSLVGHFLFTAAYRHAPANVLAPVNYLHLVWAGLLGLIVFGHVPDPLGLLGMAIIAGAGVAAALTLAVRTRDCQGCEGVVVRRTGSYRNLKVPRCRRASSARPASRFRPSAMAAWG